MTKRIDSKNDPIATRNIAFIEKIISIRSDIISSIARINIAATIIAISMIGIGAVIIRIAIEGGIA